MKIQEQEIRRIVRYTLSAGSSFVLDLGLFAVFEWVLSSFLQINITLVIIFSTILARILSSIYNYLINSRLVFKRRGRRNIVLYFLLVVAQMGMSAGMVSILENMTGGFPVLIKFCVDIIIFITNYLLQRFIVFR